MTTLPIFDACKSVRSPFFDLEVRSPFFHLEQTKHDDDVLPIFRHDTADYSSMSNRAFG